MKNRVIAFGGLLATALLLGACAGSPTRAGAWQVLLNGDKGLANFNQVGEASWRSEGGAIVADKAPGGYLVSKQSYGDFELKVEFWSDEYVNSGVMIRCSDANSITPFNAYEVNIYDRRPDPTYGTGAIVDVAKVPGTLKAAGKWNTLDITARGTRLIVVLNGVETVNVENSKYSRGPFALQFAPPLDGKPPVGVIKWRKVQIKTL